MDARNTPGLDPGAGHGEKICRIGETTQPTRNHANFSKRTLEHGTAQVSPETERMPDTYNYPAEIERDEDGRYVVTFPDFGWGATDGATREEALLEAKDLLRELLAATIREGELLPEPSRAGRGMRVTVTFDEAA